MFSSRNLLLLVCCTFVLPCGAQNTASATTSAKTTAKAVTGNKVATNLVATNVKKHVKKAAPRRSRRGGAYLVPPPPAYMPTILPEQYANQSIDPVEAAPKPENPYTKYIYSRDGNAPEAKQTRSGVVTWKKS